MPTIPSNGNVNWYVSMANISRYLTQLKLNIQLVVECNTYEI